MLERFEFAEWTHNADMVPATDGWWVRYKDVAALEVFVKEVKEAMEDDVCICEDVDTGGGYCCACRCLSPEIKAAIARLDAGPNPITTWCEGRR